MIVRIYFQPGDRKGTAKARIIHAALAHLFGKRGITVKKETAQQQKPIFMVQVGSERAHNLMVVELEPADDDELEEVVFISKAIQEDSLRALNDRIGSLDDRNDVIIQIVSKK